MLQKNPLNPLSLLWLLEHKADECITWLKTQKASRVLSQQSLRRQMISTTSEASTSPRFSNVYSVLFCCVMLK